MRVPGELRRRCASRRFSVAGDLQPTCEQSVVTRARADGSDCRGNDVPRASLRDRRRARRTWRSTRPCSNAVAGGAGTAYLRTYGWTTPTLEPRLLPASGRSSGRSAISIVPLVRRLTGGGAIWHHHELTYALVVAASHPLARPSTGLYQAVHAAIAGALWSGEFPPSDAAKRRDQGMLTENDPYYALRTSIRKIL